MAALPSPQNKAVRQGPMTGLAAVVLCALVLLIGSGRAEAATRATLDVSLEDGFGRIILSFPELPPYEIEASTGVLVISFGEPVDVEIEDVEIVLGDYISVGRRDPNGMAIRFALAQAVKVNAMEAASDLFIDILPKSWSGEPPALPVDVIEKLARRAEEAERLAREALLRERRERDATDVPVRIGRLPTFTRIQLGWQEPVEAAVSRDRDVVSILFNQFGRLDFADLNVEPTDQVASAEVSYALDGMTIRLLIDPEARLRTFREGTAYIIDILSPDRSTMLSTGEALLPQDEPIAETSITPEDAEAAETAQPMPSSGVGSAPGVRTTFGDFAIEDAAPSPFDVRSDAALPTLEGVQSDDDAAEERRRAAALARDRSPEAATIERVNPFADAVSVRVRATVQDNAVRMTFPFPSMTPSAVFTRANVVWLVFDTAFPIDARAIRRVGGDRIVDMTQTRADGVQILRLVLAGPSLITTTQAMQDWIVTIGDMVLEPAEPLDLVRGSRDNGDPVVTIDLVDAGTVHWARDPLVGDMVAIVTAHGPARSVVKAESLVDFRALQTAHGVAIAPRSDNVTVELRGDRLQIARDGGLSLTGSNLRLRNISRDVSGAMFNTNYVNLNVWRESGGKTPAEQIAALELAMANAAEDERDGVRLALARLLLAHGLLSEAHGLMRLTATENEAIANDPTFLALRGVTNILMGRVAEGRADLSHRSLRRTADTRLWLGLADAIDRDWPSAQVNLTEGKDAIATYPDDFQARFRFAIAETALETNDIATATFQLEALRDLPLAPEHRGRLNILSGRLAEIAAGGVGAKSAYEAALSTDVAPIVAEATLRLTKLLVDSGEITLEAGIERLESLVAIWRGDRIELTAMDLLTSYYMENSSPRRAFELANTAAIAHPDSDQTRDLQDRIATAFADLYLRGGADAMNPIEALSLYYDFREMTPIGRDGDEMIRRLANRLISVDLLDQAAELLDHQVYNRLTGAARAQVSAQLAMVHLMNREPSKALRVIQQSRQAVLPGSVQRQRNVLEARALSETGRIDLAMERLRDMEGADVERLRGDLLWRAESWQAAGEQIERMLDRRWAEPGALDRTESQDVMRAAIAYSLAGDDLGLDRLRRKFSEKMMNSADGPAFAVVTQPIAEKDVEFRQMVRQIADVDTLSAFLDDYRQRYAPDTLAGDTPQS